MNALRTRLGMIYVAALVLVIVSIPLLHDGRHAHASQSWPAGITRQAYSQQG